MNFMIRYLLAAAAALTMICGCSDRREKQSEMDRFIDGLMAEMTVEEKIGQLNLPVTGEITTGQARSSNVAERIKAGEVGGLFNLKGVKNIMEVQRIAVEESRMGIPLLFGMDVIHGYETIFPIPLGLSCSWDMEAIERSARIAAEEASSDGICWTFSPMVDISRDARWGRVSEGSGEDPFLGSEIAKAMVRGYQGADLETQLERNDQILACIKHFALYGAAEAGLDYNTVDMSRVRMFNEYMAPYQAGIEAGAGSVMAAFNDIDGIPATGNRWLLTDILRDRWGFGGFVVTDYTGIYEMTAHGIGDMQEVTARALDAGVDMDMVSEGFLTTSKKSLEEGRTTMAEIDRACRRILEAKYRLGLFEDPYKYCSEERAAAEIYNPEHRAKARRIAAESFVLLKNEPFKGRKILPLEKKGTIALIGPLADTRTNMPGTWSVAARHDQTLSLREGLEQTVGDKVNILYAKGSNLMSDAQYEERATMFGRSLFRDGRTDKNMLDEVLRVAAKADVIVAALGEASEMSGESSSRTDLSIPDVQQTLLKALLATGKPVVLVLFNGRPLTIEWESRNVPAILEAWFGGSEAALALSDVLFGDVNPSGKLTMTFPKNVGQIPMYYARKSTGRPLADEGAWFEKFKTNYLDVDNRPVYPFGYGLSYTDFSYSGISLSSTEMGMDGSITATVTVTNTGERDGKEIVQMYIRDMLASSTRAVRELKGFQKVMLKAGESRTVTFTITPDLLEFYNSELEKVAEPGEFKVFIGKDSDTDNEAVFTLTADKVLRPVKSRPLAFRNQDRFLDYIQHAHLNYMVEGAAPNSGLAFERIHMDGIYPQDDSNVISTGASGFGIAGLIVAMDRGFITREQGIRHLRKITDFLSKADRYHGAWPHWLIDETGKTKAFSRKDNGGDLVETAFLMEGLLCARQYLSDGNKEERKLAADIDKLWREVEWNWYQNGKDVLYWHWSPEYQWEMDFPVEGYNEALVMYILAASSPTYPITPRAYHKGWARDGEIVSSRSMYGLPLVLKHNGAEEYGGPLFWSQYSYIGLNPTGLSDRYADYWELNRNHAMIDYIYCVENPKGFKGYGPDCWGLTASYSTNGYDAHMPGNDRGVISPTAALSSFPYTPEESMAALRHFYFDLGDKIWGKYGFYDAFSESAGWYPPRYLGLDQLTIAPMIENYRTGLLWDLFMSCPEIQNGLDRLGFDPIYTPIMKLSLKS
ncbi:MAG: beta-glucosidase BglX [Bacteroidales bacterium]|nr:beta-glucosidase BglX [Bacteroidales bacterium]